MSIYDLAILTAIIAGLMSPGVVKMRLPILAKEAPEAWVIVCEYCGAFIACFVVVAIPIFGVLYAARWVYRFIAG